MRLPLIFAALCGMWVHAACADTIAPNCPPSAEGAPAIAPYDLLAAALRGDGFTLGAWKVRNGNSVEFWEGPRGWLVIEVNPARCAWVIVDLADEGDRLVSPRRANPLSPFPMQPGAPA